MSRLRDTRWIVAVLAALVAAAWPAGASPLKDDEEILFFRTVAPMNPGASAWSIPVHGWVFEPERSSIVRRLLLRALARALGLPAGSDGDALFRSRAEMFLVDSERGKDLQVRLATGVYDMPRSRPNGHFQAVPEVPRFELPGEPPQWIRFAAVPPPGDERRFAGEVQLIVPSGLAVVSDIDDTIKVTVVRDRAEMLRNTFLRPFQAVAGMAPAYQHWAQRGASFHYVSGSPWQLYPSLVRFMDESGFPAGGYHLRSLWKKGSKEPPELTGSAASHKILAIEALLEAFPDRIFVLVGDSGEEDPEIYGEIARRHPTRIRRIFIRRAPHGDESPERYQAAFEGLPAELWSVFSEPGLPEEP